ncbi:MAG: hypothetical protein EZS28_034805, partial [Streblomastix strix]
MTLFEPITANITIAIEALEQLHIDWHAIWKAIYEAGIKQQQQLDQQKNTDSYVQAYNYLYYFDNSDNVILTKQDMKKLLDRDSDNRLIENGYYYTSYLTTDDYTKLWDNQWYEQYILQYSEKYPQKIYIKYKPKKSKKLEKDDLFQVIAQNQFPFKSKYEVIRKANYYDIPTHQTKNQFDIYPQTNTLEPHDYQLKPLARFERPYFSPNYNSWEIDQVFIMKKSVEIKQYLFAINVNTKFLVVIPVKSKSQIPILDALKQLISLVQIDDIRGDGEKSYASKLLNDFYKENNINTFFTGNKFTNHNRVIDRVIRTIRNAIVQYKHKMISGLK